MKTFQQFQEQIPKPPIFKNLENLSTEVSKKINPIDLRNLILKNVTDKLITPTANKLNDKIDPNKMNQGLGNALKGFESTFGSGGKAFTDMNKLFTELGIKTNKTSITPKVPKVNTNNNLTNTPGGMK